VDPSQKRQGDLANNNKSFAKQNKNLAYRKRSESFRVNRRLMDENIFRAIIGDDETESFLDIEPFDGSRCDAIRKAPDRKGGVDLGRKFVDGKDTVARDTRSGFDKGSEHGC
jgi:hypothetical protein